MDEHTPGIEIGFLAPEHHLFYDTIPINHDFEHLTIEINLLIQDLLIILIFIKSIRNMYISQKGGCGGSTWVW